MRFLRLSDRPPSVRWATYLMVADAAVSLLAVLGEGVASQSLDLAIVFLVVLQLAHLALVFAIAIGRRWAAVAYVLWFLYTVVNLSLNRHVYLSHGPLLIVWVAGSVAVEAIAIVLLVTPTARAWFASPSAAS